MSEFKVGDWVYAGEWIYGQIDYVGTDWADVVYETESGGGRLGFGFEDLKPAPAPEEKFEIADKPSYAVVVTFSYDPQVSVLLFNDEKSAMDFIKKDVEEELQTDKENGWDTEYVIYEDEGRAVLTTHWADKDDTVEWRIGTIYGHE